MERRQIMSTIIDFLIIVLFALCGLILAVIIAGIGLIATLPCYDAGIIFMFMAVAIVILSWFIDILYSFIMERIFEEKFVY
jgi:uncharacterized membrane protein YdbT with pleckstrin-like domain